MCGLVSGFIGEPVDTIAILVIVALNAVIGAVQEYRAERAVTALREMMAPEARVLREGVVQTVAVDRLVPGDVVILEAGMVVPADLRLLHAHALQLDEAPLTGESLAVDIRAAASRTASAFSGRPSRKRAPHRRVAAAFAC